jgi:hypothetical protein
MIECDIDERPESVLMLRTNALYSSAFRIEVNALKPLLKSVDGVCCVVACQDASQEVSCS